MKKICFFFLFIFTPFLMFPSVGRNIRFEHILPDFNKESIPAVSSILQDREGFMWFGTGIGLAKYDGYNFTLYSPPQPDQKSSLRFVSVFPIFEDSNGDIWFGTNGHGLFRLAKENEKFVQFKHDPENAESITGNIVLSLQEDKNGDLYIGTRFNGLCRYNRQNNTFTKISLGQDVDTIWDLMTDSKNNIWIGTQETGLFKFNPYTQKSQNFKHNPDDPSSISGNSVWSIYEDEQGTIWVGAKNQGLNKYDEERGRFITYYGNEIGENDLRNLNITAVWEDNAGRLWIGTSGDGLRIFDKKNKKYVAYKHNPYDQDSLSDNSITSIYQDSSGIMWVTTLRGGINKTPNNQVKFDHFKHNPHNPQSIRQSDVRSICYDSSGFLWIGTSEGLDRIDEKKGLTTHFFHNSADDKSISAGDVQAVIEDEDGIIWVGTNKAGLNRFDPITGFFTHYKKIKGAKNCLSNNNIITIHNDKEDKDILWIGTYIGLNKFNKKTGKFTNYFGSLIDTSKLSSSKITTIYEDRSGALWVGTKWGLNKMNKKTGKFIQYLNNSKTFKRDTVIDNHITSFLEDSASIIWIGTFQGLNRYDRAKEKWKYYTTQEGLPGDIIYGILEDNTGNLWVSSNRGLLQFDPENESITNYGLHDGIQANKFNPGAFFKSSDGRMFFGGINGYNSFYPKNIKNNPFIPPVAWTAFYRHDKKRNFDQPLSSLRNVKLTYKADFITFEFAALCYAYPERNQFAYKLEGKDKDWVYAGPNRAISFSGLVKGEYILHIKASNPDGVWNEKGLSINIEIIPPFWKTWWFITFAAAVAVIIILSWVRMRTRLKSAQTVYKENLEKVFKKHEISSREQDIITLILDGASNKDIEKKLFISSSTVRNHIYNIYQKLNIQNRIELINLIRKQS